MPTQPRGEFADDKKTRNRIIAEILHECREYGFDEGAIVVKRLSHLPACSVPSNWGIVMRLNMYAYDINAYEPIVVKWVKDGSETKHMPDELYLIHRAIEDETLMFMLNCQEAGYEELLENDDDDDVLGGHNGCC